MLVLRDETLECLELLVEMRLALSSPITVEERVVVVVPEPVVSVSVVSVSVVVDAPPPLSLPPPQPISMKNDSRRTENEKRFEKVSFLTLLYLKNVPTSSRYIIPLHHPATKDYSMVFLILLTVIRYSKYRICQVIFLLYYLVVL